jgi:hypothetical protein
VNCSGVLRTGSVPSATSFSLVSGNCRPRGARVASLGPRAALRDVGDRMVREGNDGVRRPLGRGPWWASLGRLGCPAPQVLQDAPCHAWIVDERNDPHRPLAARTLERIDLVELANEPRPSGLGTRGELARRFDGCGGRPRRIFVPQRLRPLAPGPVRISADGANQVLVAIRRCGGLTTFGGET